MPGQRPAVFIGSSSEGKSYAHHLQAALEDDCEATVWDQGVFGLSDNYLHSLVAKSREVDFAILVLTPDDERRTRGRDAPCARDNVIFEAGLFVGAIGTTRTFFVHADDLELELPSDLDGITTCTFRSQRHDENLRAAIEPAALVIREAMASLGACTPPDGQRELPVAEQRAALSSELNLLTTNAEAQRWAVTTRNQFAYRLLSPEGDPHSLGLGPPLDTRVRLRPFAQGLVKHGLRVDPSLLDESLPPPGGRRAAE